MHDLRTRGEYAYYYTTGAVHKKASNSRQQKHVI